MKTFFILLFGTLLLANPLIFHPPKLSSPQEEIIAQFSEEIKHSSLKIALVMPKKIIGRYSVASIDTIMAYLSARGAEFEFEVFDSGDEEEESIQKVYQEITQHNFQFIIAIFTSKGAYQASKLPLKIPLYIPTVNATQIGFDPSTNPMLFFGGISYKDQIRELLRLHTPDQNIIAYNDDSPVGDRLSNTLLDLIPNIHSQTITNQDAATFSKQARTQEKLINQADVFLNTPVVKSGLLLSQIGYFRKKASKFLSTQINYNPSIIVLTQKRDRKNLFIASSIAQTNQKLIEYGSLLNSDLKFDWVNYSTALGMEMFYRIMFSDSLPYFKETIKNNQIQYTTQIYFIDTKGFFTPIDPSLLKTPPIEPQEVIPPILEPSGEGEIPQEEAEIPQEQSQEDKLSSDLILEG
ncbi:hypothetical protein [Helicobacter pametensis]|uniref:hypothetical protein n=1 Tax=Helicobacter pametensis TaxID=95149 RepID=UPI0004B839CE|nr:hypothetical protein [Helicobacter pametensis]